MSVMAKRFPYFDGNWKLAVPIKVREESWQQPIATKTHLGWTIQGGKTNSSTQHMLNIHTCVCQKRCEELYELVKTYFNMEKPIPSTSLSTDDSCAMEILNSTCKQIGERYEVGLMWKNSHSYDNAFRRLM
ncbi:hypothetical protein CVS40_11600 [Lucilia cuprina]|nr:hypothetical protein CVS40_11600 [Lucilia cuprina]